MKKNIAIIFTIVCLSLLSGTLMAGNILDKAGNPTATPVTAYSLRLLSSAYAGNAIQVRRSSDNSTQDIGFTAAGDLDTAALKTFVGSGNGFVSIWYDQSGNGVNATQTTTSNQPQIVTSGIISRDNGKPVVYTSATGYLSYVVTQLSGGYQATRMAVQRSRSGSTGVIIEGLGNYQMDMQFLSADSMIMQVNSGAWISAIVPNTNALMATNSIRNNNASKLYVNGTLMGTNTASIGTFASSVTGMIGVRNDFGGAGPGAFSETILFSSVLSDADRQAIDSNQINYYSLIPPSHVLDKIGNPAAGPVAAFSLRQMSSAYAGKAIQVRRSSDNTTQDIGFLASGYLDTAALKTFVGGGNGFVSIWYDQSGNAINATQTTTANQPQIVTSGVINRDNGLPAIYTSASGYLTYGGMSQFNGTYQATRMTVARSRNGSAGATIDGLSNYTLDCQLLSPTSIQIQIYPGSGNVVTGNVSNTNALMALNEIRNNGASKLYVNGGLLGTSSNSIGAFGSSVTGYIGVRGDLGGQPGAFSETILFNTVLTDADRQAIDSNQITYYALLKPLDKVGAPSAKPVTAFSLRLLTSGYTGKAIQVRRSSDNALQDIGFTVAGDLDTAALKTFVGSGNGFVSIWYDQSGNGINAKQNTTSNQPQIVASGVINRDNGLPAIYTSPTGYLTYGSMNQFNGSSQATRMSIARSRNGSAGATIDGLSNYTLDCQLLTSTFIQVQINTGSSNVVTGNVVNTNALMALNVIRNTGASKLYVNGALLGTSSNSIGAFGSSTTGYIGVRGDLGGQPGAFSETILFNSVLSDADRQAIDNNQFNYYVLVNPLDKAGSPSTKPVTAFSLRQLGSAYTGKAIQVRRSSDNTLQDIGFTTAGDLDTAALKTFVGAGNGYVATWYDQSGNGINATQPTASNQPSIVTNGNINRDNGVPAIYTSASGYLTYGGMSQFNGSYKATRMSVARSRNGSAGATIDGLNNYALDCQLLSTTSLQIQINTGGSAVVTGTTGNTNALMVLNEMRDNGNSKLYVNGNLIGTSNIAIGAFGSPVTGYIGVRGDLGGQPGAFSETMLFNTVLPDADRQKIDSSQIRYFTITNEPDKIGSITASPVAAFSLRQLSTGYLGKAIQVRRSSDNTLQDIGFTSAGDLDTAALKTFVGSGNGYVSTWYDQSGQKRDKTQPTATLQPQIVNAGIVYRKGGQPVIYLPATSGVGLIGASPDYLSAGDVSVVLTAWSNSSTVAFRRAIQGKTQNWLVGPYNNHNAWNAGGFIVDDANNPWKTTGEVYTVIEPANGANDMYRSGLKSLNVANAYKGLPGSICVSAAGAFNEPMDGYMSELLEFNTALSINDRNTVEQNTGSYNSINVHSNNLAGAWLPAIQPAEVFSLRQVNTGYAGPLVRIKAGSSYYDVYPDDDGKLTMSSYVSASYSSYNADTTGITYNTLDSLIAGSVNSATVAIWYDQSGRGWNAVQATDANQPVLIQADTFVTAPGSTRPALLFSQAGKNYLQGDVHEVNGFNSVTVNAICYQKTVNNQVLIGKDKVWNFILGTNGINGAGSFNSSQNGTAWSDSVTRFIAFGLPSQNKVIGITGQYGNTGQTVLGNGIPLGSLNATLSALGSNSQALQISGYNGAAGSGYWDGYIQEIVLTDSVLKTEDLRLLTTNQQSYYKTRVYNSWKGSSSQSWSDACNWSGGHIPAATESAFVPAGVSQQPTVSSTVAAPDSLIVAPGATVNISSGGSFSGTAPKVILLASPSAAGYLVNTSGVSLGTTTIQKWMTGQQGFRVLAYPFSASQSSFLSTASTNNGLNLQLNSGSGSTGPSSSTPAIPDKTISDAQIFSANAWTNMVNGAASPNIPYALYYKGLATAFDSLTTSYGPSPFAFTVSGTTNTGTTVSIPAANSTTAFTMAGNPFTAPVTTLAMTGDATGNTSYYIWEIPLGATPTARTTDAGQWVPYLPGNRLLPVMTAMAFKQATASSTISIPTSAMTTSGTLHMQVSSVDKSSGSSAKSNKSDESAMEYLELEVQEKGVYRDRLFVRYDGQGADKGTDQADMEKLYNKGLNIYTLAEDKARLAVDFRREIVQPVPVGMRAAAPGHYQFVVKKINLWNANELYLRDNKLHTDTKLRNDAVYDFAIGDQEVGINERRFEIINKSALEQTQTVTQNFSARLLGNIVDGQDVVRVMIQNSEDAQVSVELFNMQGARIATKYVQSGEVDFSTAGLGSGMYVVKCTKKDKTIVLKLMK